MKKELQSIEEIGVFRKVLNPLTMENKPILFNKRWIFKRNEDHFSWEIKTCSYAGVNKTKECTENAHQPTEW